MSEILVYIGSIVVIIWGIAHILPINSVINGFGQISEDNRKIITMEWAAEGMTLVFIGFLAILVIVESGLENPVTLVVIRACAIMLLVLAGLSAMTGARTSILPMKICPFVKTACAVLLIAGTAI
ncbi:MAG: hypothetical protein WC294_03925 [Methanoregula sp.]